jgi:CubicO group peptidase (beta-lactamase class C family)
MNANKSSSPNVPKHAPERRRTKIATAAAVGLLGLAFTLAVIRASAQTGCGVPAAGADHWPVAAPESVGLASSTLCPLVQRIGDWKEGNVHSVLVVRHGSLVFEHYFSGVDEIGDTKLGEVAFGPQTKHDVRSITKSIVALLLGIAVDRG